MPRTEECSSIRGENADSGPAADLSISAKAKLLALLLGDPDLELSLTELADRTGVPHPSVFREVERAEAAGLVTSRRIGRTRLVRANVASPYYGGLADVLTKAFDVPAVLGMPFAPLTGSTRH